MMRATRYTTLVHWLMATVFPKALPPMVMPEISAVAPMEISTDEVLKSRCRCVTITAAVEPLTMPHISPTTSLHTDDIHSVALCGPVLQHAVREAAGGCADIGADLAVHGQGKRLHGLLQLQTAPADIGQSMAPHLDGGGIGHRRAGLVHPLTVNKHTAGHDNGLGLLAAFQQALLH